MTPLTWPESAAKAISDLQSTLVVAGTVRKFIHLKVDGALQRDRPQLVRGGRRLEETTEERENPDCLAAHEKNPIKRVRISSARCIAKIPHKRCYHQCSAKHDQSPSPSRDVNRFLIVLAPEQ